VTDQPKDLTPGLAGFEAGLDAKPVNLEDVRTELGMVQSVIPARDLAGQSFEIHGARLQPSTEEENKYYFFCAVRFKGDDATYGVALGADAVMEVLYRYLATNPTAPLAVTLNFHEGKGAHGGYYTLD